MTNKVEKIQPSGIFTNYIFKSIPLAFDESLSYYEMLCGILDKVKTQDEVINNNADLLAELESYVTHYFDNLDVQEEINNKLDKMAEDGTLTTLIGNYVNPLFNDFTSNINNTVNDIEHEVNEFIADTTGDINYLTNRVNSYSTSPLIASNTSDMTDTNRIYVNTTDGYWYYYDGDSWEQGGIYQSTGVETDKTLTQNGVPADAKIVGNYVLNNFYNVKSRNLLDLNNIREGFTDVDGQYYAYTQYNTLYNKIDVSAYHGKTLYFSINEQAYAMRVVTAYDSVGNVLQEKGVESANTYEVPNDVDYVIITFGGSIETAQLEIDRITTYATYFNKELPILNKEVKTNVFDSYNKKLTIATLDQAKDFDVVYNRKNFIINFYGKVTGTFYGLRIGQGLNQYSGYNIHITPTGVSYQSGTTDNGYVNHHLTIKDYIFINLEIDNDFKSHLTINTNGGTFTRIEDWYGDNKNIFVIPDTNTNITNAQLNYNAKDSKKFIWYFGDSYISGGDARIPYYLNELDYLDNIMLDGFSGANAGDVRPDVNELVTSGYIPKYIIWALGMNNGDSGAINSSWLAQFSLLRNLCDLNGITLIPCTIPNTPEVDNRYKNQYIKNCGLRYIDLASAVNTSENANTWYEGLLSNDDVHPTEEGAKCLTSKLINDFIELTY